METSRWYSTALNAVTSKLAPLAQHWQQFRERSPWLARITLWSSSLFTLLLLISTLLLLLVRFGAFGPLPDKDSLRAISNNNASTVYTADGKLLGKYFIENRIDIDYDQISQDLVNGLIATEDARFFDHKGIDLRAWVRVFLRTVLMGDESGGGGSTLSQQLAKNLFPRKRHWILTIPVNKIKEMYTARRLEKVYTKEELINLYLNTVPFGGNIFGVEVAARQYFNQSAKELKTEEAAVLVGMLKANTYYNPVRHPVRTQQRRNVVLQQMVKYGYLEEAIADSIKAIPLEVDYRYEGNNTGMATYFREQLRQELAPLLKGLKKEDGTAFNIYTDGLKVHTTLHSSMQRYAEEAVQEQMSRLQKSFNAHWKGRKPWGKEEVLLQQAVRKSARYQQLKASGLSESAILDSMDHSIPMQVFDWVKSDSIRQLSPMDSIRHYYAMLNAGFLVMDPSKGYLRAWVGGINHKY